jgi:SAM-dependent methyltransferase
MKRGYQLEFYSLSEGVRDREARSRKAEKIAYVLKTFGGRSLAGDICLDVGCSSGFITAELAPLFARTIGVEYDRVALSAASPGRPASLQFVRGDAMAMPIASNSVDVIVCAQVYEHVPDDRRLAAEMFRVLKPGGIVFFSGPNKLFPIEPHYFLPFLHWLPEDWADHYLKALRRGDHYYERSRTLWGLRRLFEPFEIRDASVDLLHWRAELILPKKLAKLAIGVPGAIWQGIVPVLPNFNWILVKPGHIG